MQWTALPTTVKWTFLYSGHCGSILLRASRSSSSRWVRSGRSSIRSRVARRNMAHIFECDRCKKRSKKLELLFVSVRRKFAEDTTVELCEECADELNSVIVEWVERGKP